MNELTIEQSKKLIDLGLDLSKADMAWYEFTYKSWNSALQDSVYDKEDIQYTYNLFNTYSKGEEWGSGSSYECTDIIPSPTLDNLLDMLPPYIRLYDKLFDYRLSLILQYDDKGDWVCGYQMNAHDTIENEYGTGIFLSKFSKSKIQVAYELLVECTKRNILETEILTIGKIC